MKPALNDAAISMAGAISSWHQLMTKSIGGRIQEWNGVWMCDFQSAHPYRNAAVLTQPLPEEKIGELIERLNDFYGRDHGWVLISTFALQCQDDRLRHSLTEPLMVLEDPSAFSAPVIEGLTIVEATSDVEVLDFERTHAEFFPRAHLLNADADELWNAKMLSGRCRIFVGYLDGMPVATGGSWQTEEINEIMGLTTRSSHRGRGIAHAMMRHAMDMSQKPPALFSSVSARPAYERMGFHVVGGVDYWVPPRFEAKYPGGW